MSNENGSSNMQNAQIQIIMRKVSFGHLYILWCPLILLDDSGGPDQTVRMRRLIWTFAVCICPKPRFRIVQSISPSFSFIMKTYNFDPLKPFFYIVKLRFTEVSIIFLISTQKHRLWVPVEPPRRCGSNEYRQSMF